MSHKLYLKEEEEKKNVVRLIKLNKVTYEDKEEYLDFKDKKELEKALEYCNRVNNKYDWETLMDEEDIVVFLDNLKGELKDKHDIEFVFSSNLERCMEGADVTNYWRIDIITDKKMRAGELEDILDNLEIVKEHPIVSSFSIYGGIEIEYDEEEEPIEILTGEHTLVILEDED